MSRWKRRLIWIATFLFGLYFIVEFVLPEQIGGAFDKNGIGAATAVNTSQGWQVYYTAMSGPVKPDGTPDEKLVQYTITRFPLDRPSQRQVVIAPSPVRQWDYFGCKSPSILVENGVWRMWYTGLDHTDRQPRVMYAVSRNGLDWDTPVKVIADPLGLEDQLKKRASDLDRSKKGVFGSRLSNQQMDDAIARLTIEDDQAKKALRQQVAWIVGGVDNVSVARDWPGYRMWFVARGADGDSIGQASSPDGLSWKIARKPLTLDKHFDRITSVSSYRAAGTWRVLFVGDGAVLEAKDGKAISTVVPAPRGVTGYASAVVAPNTNGFLMLVSYLVKGNDKKILQELAVYEGSGVGPWVERGAEVRPGPQGVRAVPIPLETMSNWITIVGTFAVAIGVIGLLQVHVRRLAKHETGWFNSLSLILSIIAMCVVFILYRRLPEGASATTVHGRDLIVFQSYDLLFWNMAVPLGSTMFSLLACYLVSAAYRAFRIRGRDATVMAISATVVMLAQVPVGDYLTSWMSAGAQESAGMAVIRQWYLDLANSAVQRGISFGVFVATVAMALRIWLSLDRIGPE